MESIIFEGNSFKRMPPNYVDTVIMQLFRIKVVQIEMILDRGYTHSATEDATHIKDTFEGRLVDDARETRQERSGYAPIQEFETYYEKKAKKLRAKPDDPVDFMYALSNIYVKVNQDDEYQYLYVRFLNSPPGKKLNTAQARIIKAEVETIVKEGIEISNLIIIGTAAFSSSATAIIQGIGIGIKSFRYEFFLSKQLVYNPTKHILYDPHIILTKQEVQDFLASNRKGGRYINLVDLPSIDISDVIIRYFGANVGDVIKILSRGHIGSIIPSTIDYRLVIKKEIKNEGEEIKEEGPPE